MANSLKYREIYELLRKDILAGRYKVGELLPSELNLCAELGVGRSTLRRSLELLNEEELVSSHQGRGTMVIWSGSQSSPISSARSHVMRWSPRVPKGEPCVYTQSPLVIDTVFASSEVAAQMGMPEGCRVFRVQRLRYVNDKPYCFIINFINPKIAPDLDKDAGTVGDHLSEYIVRRYGIRRTHWEMKVDIHLAQFKEAQFFRLELNRPLFIMKRISHFNDEIFDYSELMYNPDLVDFCLVLNPNPKIDQGAEQLQDVDSD